MNDSEQKATSGFSASEKAQLIRGAICGLGAFLLTLWLGNVFDADGPPLFSLPIILAGLFSMLAALLVSVMGESVIEDVIKLIMFGVLWWFTRQYDAFALITLGMMVGSGIGFLNNRV